MPDSFRSETEREEKKQPERLIEAEINSQQLYLAFRHTTKWVAEWDS